MNHLFSGNSFVLDPLSYFSKGEMVILCYFPRGGKPAPQSGGWEGDDLNMQQIQTQVFTKTNSQY